MQHHPIASFTRSTAVMACIAAFVLALAATADARPAQQLSEHGGEQSQQTQPQQLSEHGGEQATQPPTATNPRVGDTPSDRVSPTAAPAATESGSTGSSDGNGNAPLIVGLSILSVALIASGTYVVRRRRHLAPGH